MCTPSRLKSLMMKLMPKSPPRAGDEAGQASLRTVIHAASVATAVIVTAGAVVDAVAGAMNGATTVRGRAHAASRGAMIAGISPAAKTSAAMNLGVMTHAGMIVGPNVVTSRVTTVARKAAPASMTMRSGVNPRRRVRLAQAKTRHPRAMNP